MMCIYSNQSVAQSFDVSNFVMTKALLPNFYMYIWSGFFVSKSLAGIKIATLTTKPRSLVRILIYRTWAIDFKDSFSVLYRPSPLPHRWNRVQLEVKTESKGPRTIMPLVYVGAGDSSNQPKIEIQRQ